MVVIITLIAVAVFALLGSKLYRKGYNDGHAEALKSQETKIKIKKTK